MDLAITMLQMPHGMGGYGMTPTVSAEADSDAMPAQLVRSMTLTETANVIVQISSKVAMASRFIGFVGSLSSSEQQFPNQNVPDPDTWTLSHLLQLKQEYKKLVEDFKL